MNQNKGKPEQHWNGKRKQAKQPKQARNYLIGKGRQNQIKKATASNRASYSLSAKPIAYLVVQQAKQAKEAKQVKQAKPEPHERKMNPT